MNERVIELLKQVIGLDKLLLLALPVTGKVTEVNDQEKTCDVRPDNGGADLLDVRLKPILDGKDSGLILTPAVGAAVVVLMLDEQNGILISCSELKSLQVKVGSNSAIIDKDGWQFNGGNLGGLVKLENLVDRLNRLEDRMKNHQHQYLTPAGTPAPTAPDPATNAFFINTTKNDLENPKVKH